LCHEKRVSYHSHSQSHRRDSLPPPIIIRLTPSAAMVDSIDREAYEHYGKWIHSFLGMPESHLFDTTIIDMYMLEVLLTADLAPRSKTGLSREQYKAVKQQVIFTVHYLCLHCPYLSSALKHASSGFSRFRKRTRPPSTTMPWTIWPALVVS